MNWVRQHIFRLSAALMALTLCVACSSNSAENTSIGIGYQTVVDPSKVPQADGEYDRALGRTIDWRKFASGSEAIAALASGDVQIADIGSSPLATAATRELPIVAFLVIAEIRQSEALVARKDSNIRTPQDLIGKRLAVPFVSTTHYSLLAALRHWKIDPGKLAIVNLRPAEIGAAWQRGDIDAAYVWDPVLGALKSTGTVIATSEDVADWGSPTYEVWVVRKDFAAKHPELVARFAQVTLAAHAAYREHPEAWHPQSSQVEKIARITGAQKSQIPALLAGNHYPVADEQVSARLLGGGFAKALRQTAQFLKDQKTVDIVLPSYASFVDARFADQAGSK